MLVCGFLKTLREVVCDVFSDVYVSKDNVYIYIYLCVCVCECIYIYVYL